MNRFIEIRTERLLLRRLQESDWEMISYLRSDEEVNRFILRPGAETREKALEFINRIREENNRDNCYYWCITLIDTPDMIGSISLWNFSADRKTAEVGYDLGTAFQGRGIMKEALGGILNFGFKKLSLETIEAYTQWNNDKSISLLKNSGFSLVEGGIDPDNRANLIYKIQAP